jgi:hypothetical protein
VIPNDTSDEESGVESKKYPTKLLEEKSKGGNKKEEEYKEPHVKELKKE